MAGSAHMLCVFAGLVSSLSLSPPADAFVFQLQPPPARLAQLRAHSAHRRPALCALPPRLAACSRPRICRLRLSDSMDDMQPEEAMVERLLERLETGIESAASQERFQEASALRDEISRMHMDDTSSVLRVSAARTGGRAFACRQVSPGIASLVQVDVPHAALASPQPCALSSPRSSARAEETWSGKLVAQKLVARVSSLSRLRVCWCERFVQYTCTRAPRALTKLLCAQVNSDFYRAFSTKNISLMGTVWHNSPHVQCIHPGAKPLVGYDNIVSMWSNMFQVTCVRVALALPHQERVTPHDG